MSVFFRRRGVPQTPPQPTVDYKTWLLNEDIRDPIEAEANFESNNQSYRWIDGYTSQYVFSIYYDNYKVYSYQGTGNWVNQAYRTVVFDAVPTGTLRTWLEANATPI